MPWFRWPLYQRVLVNLTNGDAIEALLMDRRGRLLVLTDATYMTASTEPSHMDGEVYVERDKVLFIQATKGG